MSMDPGEFEEALARLPRREGESTRTGAEADRKLREMAGSALVGPDVPFLVLVVEQRGAGELELAVGGTIRPSRVASTLRIIADEYERRIAAKQN